MYFFNHIPIITLSSSLSQCIFLFNNSSLFSCQCVCARTHALAHTSHCLQFGLLDWAWVDYCLLKTGKFTDNAHHWGIWHSPSKCKWVITTQGGYKVFQKIFIKYTFCTCLCIWYVHVYADPRLVLTVSLNYSPPYWGESFNQTNQS